MRITTAGRRRRSICALFTASALILTGAFVNSSGPSGDASSPELPEIRAEQGSSSWTPPLAMRSPITSRNTDAATFEEELIEAMEMKTSQAGIDLIKAHEGLRLNAYYCSAGKCTIGWGHTEGVKPGMVITRDQAEEFLKQDLERFAAQVTKALDADELEVTQGQFDAMVAFAFNVKGGVSTLVKSSIWRNLKGGDITAAGDCFRKFVYAHDKNDKLIKLAGLETRREAERALFLGLA